MTELIKIQTSRFGEVEVRINSVINFAQGPVGFAEFKQFVVLDYKGPFSWLQSLENPALAFLVVDGANFGSKYKIDPAAAARELDLGAKDDFAVLVVIAVDVATSAPTANLKAPIIVNLNNRKGAQVVFDDDKLSAQVPLKELLG